MIDSFPFEGWYNADGVFDPNLGSYWPYVGAESGPAYGDTSASAGTWILTILGMVLIIVAYIGWFRFEGRRLREAAERIRASGRWHRGAPRPDGLEPPTPPGGGHV